MHFKTRVPHPWGATADKAPATYTKTRNTALLHRCTSCPCLCLQCTRAPFPFTFFKKKQNKEGISQRAKASKKKANTKGRGQQTKGGGTKQTNTGKTTKRRVGVLPQSHQQHAQAAHSARTGEQGPSGHRHRTPNTKGALSGEQAPRGPGHRTRTHTKGGRETGRNEPHPQGRTHWVDPADPSGQWQERYTKAAGPSPARKF